MRWTPKPSRDRLDGGSGPVLAATDANTDLSANLQRSSAIVMATASTILFLAFLTTVGCVHIIDRWMRERSITARLVQTFRQMAVDASRATVGDLVSIAHQWQDADQLLAGRVQAESQAESSDDAADATTTARSTAARAIGLRAVALLEQPDYLDMSEAATLAATVHLLEKAHALAALTPLARSHIDRVLAITLERGTRTILYLGRPTATAAELHEGSLVATQLATVVPQDRSDDFTQAAALLATREATLQRMARRANDRKVSSEGQSVDTGSTSSLATGAAYGAQQHISRSVDQSGGRNP